MIVEMKINSVDRRDTTYYDVAVKIGEEEFQVEGDDRSGWDDECVEALNEHLSEIGSDLTFENLIDLHGEKGDKFEI